MAKKLLLEKALSICLIYIINAYWPFISVILCVEGFCSQDAYNQRSSSLVFAFIRQCG